MRLFFDCEFIEDGRTIELLSIGVVREDGATYYAEPLEATFRGASAWVAEHVIPHMTRAPAPGEGSLEAFHRARATVLKPRKEIAAELLEFAGPSPEWWAYVCQYDWVALRQLYGRMVDMPEGWPYGCRDVEELTRLCGMRDLDFMPAEHELVGPHAGRGDLILPEGAHHALAGAWYAHDLAHVCRDELRATYAEPQIDRRLDVFEPGGLLA